jgi:hypothetical protein
MPTIKEQKKTYGPVIYTEDGQKYRITAEVRHDDECGNGHNSFSITGEIRISSGGYWRDHSGGCLHEDIAKHFPRLAPFIKWHLCATDGPMHYVANTMYWLGFHGYCKEGEATTPPNLEHARSTAVWPDLPEEFVAPRWIRYGRNAAQTGLGRAVRATLEARLPALLAEFRRDVEALGFTF